MKALEFLKNQEYNLRYGVDSGFEEHSFELKQLEEAISELEELCIGGIESMEMLYINDIKLELESCKISYNAIKKELEALQNRSCLTCELAPICELFRICGNEYFYCSHYKQRL